MVRSVAGNLPEQVKNNQSVNTAAGNGGQKMSQYSWFTVYIGTCIYIVANTKTAVESDNFLSHSTTVSPFFCFHVLPSLKQIAGRMLVIHVTGFGCDHVITDSYSENPRFG